MLVAAAVVLASAGCAVSQEPDSDPVKPPPMHLAAYESCAALLGGLRRATARQVGPHGLTGLGDMVALERATGGAVPGAARAVPSHSRTNSYEPDAAEPDLVKTDGRRIIALGGGDLHVIDPASRKIAHTLDLPGGPWGGTRELLMGDGRVLVLESRPRLRHFSPRTAEPGPRPGPRPDTGPRTRLTLVDVTGAPRVLGTMTSAAAYLDARQTGSTVHIVVKSTPRIDFPEPAGDDPGGDRAAIAANRKAVEKAPLNAWLPAFRFEPAEGAPARGRTRGAETVRPECGKVAHPASYGGGSTVLSVLSVGLRDGLDDADALGIAIDGSTVYGTGEHLYITGTAPRPYAERDRPVARTDVHKLELGEDGGAAFGASGSVPGRLLNQYALSEHDGRLRIATTSRPHDSESSVSAVRVLERRGPGLVEIGEVGGLGKTERIHAVRFMGPTAYVVTFRRTDPLYVLDLSDPRRPRVTGELKITGYSAYLHPVADGRLLGVGQDADTSGRVQGLQVSLFDVTGAPRRIAAYRVPEASSEAEFDPHAFLYWARTGLTVLPVREPGDGTSDALVLKVTRDGVAKSGTIQHPGASIRRSLVIGDTLWTFSDDGARASDAATLTGRAWLPYE